jgi:hypothetical protein
VDVAVRLRSCSSALWSTSLRAIRCRTSPSALPDAVDREQRAAQQRAALRLRDLRPDDDVDGAGLVFQRHEDHALGRLRPLAVRDDAAGACQPAAGIGAQLGGGLDLEGRQLAAQQRHRVLLRLRPVLR